MNDDALHRLFQNGSADDTRFQFEIIKQLSENVRVLASGVADMQKLQAQVVERLTRLEANRVDETVGKLEAKIEVLAARIGDLEQDKDRRDGAMGLVSKFPGWLSFIIAAASVFSAIYLAGRATGVVSAPPTPAPAHRLEAVVPREPEDRTVLPTPATK